MLLLKLIVIPAITAIAAGLLGYILGIRKELKTAYLLSFEEWCSKLYGEIVELKERYFYNEACFTKKEFKQILEKYPKSKEVLWPIKKEKDDKVYVDIDKISNNQKGILGKTLLEEIIKHAEPDNPVLIIADYRELHERLRDAPRWRSKIEKEDETVADYLRELTNLIDKEWHALQHKHDFNFQTDSSKGNWLEQIIRTEKKEREKISKEIKGKGIKDLKSMLKSIRESKDKKEKREVFEVIKEYLQSKVPRKFFIRDYKGLFCLRLKRFFQSK